MENFVFSGAAPDDAPELLSLIIETNQGHTFLGDRSGDPPIALMDIETLSGILADDDCLAYVAREVPRRGKRKGRIAASILFRNEREYIYGFRLCVLRELQGKGLGKIILKEAILVATRIFGVNIVKVNVDGRFAKMADWYRRLGFTGDADPAPLDPASPFYKVTKTYYTLSYDAGPASLPGQ